MDENLYVVVEDFTADREGFLSVKKGQLVEVLDQGLNNWLVLTIASAVGELEDEGFLPAHCLQPASKSELVEGCVIASIVMFTFSSCSLVVPNTVVISMRASVKPVRVIAS